MADAGTRAKAQRRRCGCIPVVTVSRQRLRAGRQYGAQARERIHRSLAAYDATFAYYAGWTWPEAARRPTLFLPAIEAFAPDLLEELAGIAAGAEVARDDILAINVRTEIMFSARIKAAMAAAGRRAHRVLGVCAAPRPAAACSRARTGTGRRSPHDTVVVLRAEPDDGPAFVTVVEAGLLAKFGVNSAGLAVMTNALSCTDDDGDTPACRTT